MALRGSTWLSGFMVALTAPGGGFRSPASTTTAETGTSTSVRYERFMVCFPLGHMSVAGSRLVAVVRMRVRIRRDIGFVDDRTDRVSGGNAVIAAGVAAGRIANDQVTGGGRLNAEVI